MTQSAACLRRPAVAMPLALVVMAVAACGPSVPVLVRDDAGLFSANARSEGQTRLAEIARRHGIWVFVVSERNGDEPRMLDEPMGEADRAGKPAAAVLFIENGGVVRIAAGWSRVVTDEMRGMFEPPGVGEPFEASRADDALAALVTYLEEWAVDPGDPPPIGPPPAEPSG